jgi:hypothetical protein
MAHVSGKLVSFTKAIATLAMILTMAGLKLPFTQFAANAPPQTKK